MDGKGITEKEGREGTSPRFGIAPRAKRVPTHRAGEVLIYGSPDQTVRPTGPCANHFPAPDHPSGRQASLPSRGTPPHTQPRIGGVTYMARLGVDRGGRSGGPTGTRTFGSPPVGPSAQTQRRPGFRDGIGGIYACMRLSRGPGRDSSRDAAPARESRLG